MRERERERERDREREKVGKLKELLFYTFIKERLKTFYTQDELGHV